jgi:hypothetical protein
LDRIEVQELVTKLVKEGNEVYVVTRKSPYNRVLNDGYNLGNQISNVYL